MKRLDGKLALITGAAIGLGAAIARRFHEEGAQVIVNDVNAEAVEATAKELDGAAVIADVSDSAAVTDMFAQVSDRYGRLDVLVNNAGIGLQSDKEAQRFMDLTRKQAEELARGDAIETHTDFTVNLGDEAWHRMIGVHLNGTFYCTREALRIMNPQNSGVILNMGSIMGTAGGSGLSSYCAAKAGIMGFTRSLARELASRNIRVNSIAPGFIETAMTEPFRAVHKGIADQTPMRRLGDPDDVAWAAVYLASDEAKFVTGQALSPNGGYHMSQ